MPPRYLPFPVRTHRRIRWIWRALPALAAVAMGLTAFQLGVGVDAREGMAGAGLLAHLYAVCSLFVLGGLDLGLPTGSTSAARALLWGAYFLAPTVTAVAVVEAFLESLQPGWWQRPRLKDHLIVIGAGSMGTLYLEALRAEEPRAPVLIVDQDPSSEAVARHFGAAFLNGDVRWKPTRDQLSLQRARGVLVMTGDDLNNLGTATDLIEEAPNLAGRIVVHVRDLGLRRTLNRKLPGREAGPLPSYESDLGHIFNSHRVAAQHLVEHRLRAHFALTEASDVVVLAGFGRFNQTILETLQAQALGEFHAVVIVDVHARIQARAFEEQVGFGDYSTEVIEGDMNNTEVWEEVKEACSGVVSPAYVLGSDQDSTNLRVAMGLRERYPAARIFARCFDESAFTRRLAREDGFEISSVADLLRSSFRLHHRTWFGGE